MTAATAFADTASPPASGKRLSLPLALVLEFKQVPRGELDGVEVAVLLAIAAHHNERWEAWPSIESVAEESHWDERTVYRALASLRDKKWFEIDPPFTYRGRPSDRSTNLYRFLPADRRGRTLKISSAPPVAAGSAQADLRDGAPTRTQDVSAPPSGEAPRAAPTPVTSARNVAEGAILLTLRELEPSLGGFVSQAFAQRLWRIGKAKHKPALAVRAAIHQAALDIENRRDHGIITDLEASETVIRYVKHVNPGDVPPSQASRVIVVDAAPASTPDRTAVAAGMKGALGAITPWSTGAGPPSARRRPS